MTHAPRAPTERSSPAIRTSLQGRPVDVDLDRLELESARRALHLLHERIPPDYMSALLAHDLELADARWSSWAKESDGRWRPCIVDFQVQDLNRAEFTTWWSRATDDIYGVMYPAYPEHFLFNWATTTYGRALQVIEELGHAPFRMYCSYGPQWAPSGSAPGYDIISTGVGRLADGTEVTRFMTQVREDDNCLHIKAGFYAISAVPDEVMAAHQDQMLVEWTRWIEMAIRHVAGNRNREENHSCQTIAAGDLSTSLAPDNDTHQE